jgi:hypothetical protein
MFLILIMMHFIFITNLHLIAVLHTVLLCNAQSKRKEFDQPIHKTIERRRSEKKAQFIKKTIFLRIVSEEEYMPTSHQKTILLKDILKKRSIRTPTMPAKQSFTPNQVRNDPIRRYLQ